MPRAATEVEMRMLATPSSPILLRVSSALADLSPHFGAVIICKCVERTEDLHDRGPVFETLKIVY